MRHKGWLALLLLAFLAGWFGHSLLAPGTGTGPVPGGELAMPRTEDPRPPSPGLAAAPAQPPGPIPVDRRRAEEPAVVTGAVQTLPRAGDTSTGTLRVRVREFSGAAVPGVALEVTLMQQNPVSRAATTDADGTAEFPALAPGEWHVEISFPEGKQGSNASVFGGRVTEVALTHPARGVRFEGTVRDIAKGALEGVTVTLSSMAGGSYTTLTAKTNANGFYRFESVRPGSWSVSLSSNASASGSSQSTVVFVPPDETFRKDFVSGPLLRGTVRDRSSRAPIAGAQIAAQQEGRYSDLVSTDSQGVFEVKGLHPGMCEVVLSRAGYGLAIVRNVVVGAEDTVVELEMSPAARLRLHVTDANGQPVSGSIFIGASPKDEAQGTNVASGFQADADGRGSFDQILPGGYVLTFKAKGVGEAQVETSLVLGENSLEVRLKAK